MKKLLLTMLTVVTLMTSCSKEETLPEPIVITQPSPVQNNDSITTKIVKLDVESYGSGSISTYSTNGILIDMYEYGQWYEVELDEGEFLQVTSTNQIYIGTPYIDIYVNNVLVNTIYSTNSTVSYTYVNDSN